MRACVCSSVWDEVEENGTDNANDDIRNRQDMEAELDEHKPTRVLCAAGLTGRPNVDWCETNQVRLFFIFPSQRNRVRVPQLARGGAECWRCPGAN